LVARSFQDRIAKLSSFADDKKSFNLQTAAAAAALANGSPNGPGQLLDALAAPFAGDGWTSIILDTFFYSRLR
jgi:hypothetical protein